MFADIPMWMAVAVPATAFFLGMGMTLFFVGVRALYGPEPEQVPVEVPVPTPVFGMQNFFAGLVEPPPLAIDPGYDRQVFSGSGFVGDLTGEFRIVDEKPIEPPAVPARQRFEITATHGDYPTIHTLLEVGGRR